MQDNKSYVMLVKPKEKPTIIDIEANKNGIASQINGDVDCLSVPEDNIDIYFDRLGIINNKTPNRVIKITQAREKDMTYSELKELFREAEEQGKHTVGFITFTKDSFNEEHSVEARTYAISSNNKAFQANMGGYSIFGSCLDGIDTGVRLDWYMSAERGGKDGWKIERCYTKEKEQVYKKVAAGNILVCSKMNENNTFDDISQEMVDKYAAMFREIPKFIRIGNGEIGVLNDNVPSNATPER